MKRFFLACFLLLASVLSSPAPDVRVTGLGQTNYFPIWRNGFSITTNSQIYQLGTLIGIGTTNPATELMVQGVIGLKGNPFLTWNGTGNNFIGTDAGSNRTTGDFNTLIGYQTGKSLTVNNSVVAIGYQAALNIGPLAIHSTIIGTAAGQNLNAPLNTIYGYHAGRLLTNGQENVLIGDMAGSAMTNAQYNTIVGANAGLANQGGNNNTFVGRQAGTANVSGSDNVIIGHQAGLAATTSTSLTIVGVEAGKTLTSSANNNTFVGYRSGNVDTANNNTFFGYGSGIANTTGTDNICIGINATTTTESNHTLIGGPGRATTNFFIGEGITDASPLALWVRTTGASGADIAAANFNLVASPGTGTGVGGSIKLWTAGAGSTGASLNTLTNRFSIGPTGKIDLETTITAVGTTTTQTIDKMSGRVNVAAAGTTVTVNNANCTTNSLVFATIASNDTTATLKNAVSGTGSFIITLTAAANAETKINWLIIN